MFPGRLLGWARRLAVPAAGAVADLAWHLAGPAAATAILAAAVVWLALRLPAAMITAAQASAKAYAVERRMDAVVGQIPAPQTSPGQANNGSYGASNSSYGTSNSSYGLSGGTTATYNSGSGNQGGGPGSQTSGQIGGASAHYHDMTHYHTTSSALENWGNALRNSHSDLVPAVNALRDSHSDLVPAVNALRDSHSTLISTHNTLISRLEASGLLR
jgi:hypothetical protein